MFTIRLLAILVVMSLSSISAVTVHVPQDQPTIQAGIDAAGYRDTVLVAPGTYLENVSFLGKAIVLVSSGGRDVTFIEQALAGAPIITFSGGENSLTILDGFTIRNATGNCGIFCYYADPIIQNCDVSFCLSPFDGVGIYCQGSGATIRYNLIHDNHGAGTGGGIGGKTSAGLEVAHNSIYSNSCPNGPGIGLIAPTAHVQIHHNLFFRNNVGYKGLNSSLYINGADCEILNNTFVENTGGIKLLNGAGTTILNNIIVSNEQSGIDPAAAYVDYNDVWNNGSANDPGPNGISDDPMFTDPLNNDFTLQATSPCVDAGDPDPQYNDPDGSRNDMGAFPYTIQPNLPLPLNLNLGVEENLHVVSHTPTFFWTFYDTAGTQAAFTLEVGTDDDWSMSEMWVSGDVMSTDTFALYAGSTLDDGETYFYRARLSNESGWGDWREASFRMNSFPIPPVPIFPVGQASVNSNGCQLWVLNSTDADDDSLIYDYEVYDDPDLSTLIHSDSLITERADSTKSGTVFGLVIGVEYWWRCRSFDCYEYSAWSSVESFVTNAASVINVPEDQPTIQAGIDQATSGDTVLVIDGVYIGEGNHNIDFNGKNVVLISRGGPEVTIIDCQQAGRGFYFHGGEDSTTHVEGFTIANGKILNAGMLRGGAFLCESSSPTIIDCIFENNTVLSYFCGVSGGAVSISHSSMRISNCTFRNNSVRDFSQLPGWDAWGGAIAARKSSLTVDSCLFVGNRAYSGGGISAIDSSIVFLANSTFYASIGSGSALSLGYFWDHDLSTATVENCILAFATYGLPVRCQGYSNVVTLTCCDIYGNADGDWVYEIADQSDINGNLSLDPEFCDTADIDLTLNPLSPCLAANNSCEVLIGAEVVGCDCCRKRGDINHDGNLIVDISDLVYLVDYMFAGGTEPPCLVEANVDGSVDAEVDISDLVYMVDFMFSGGQAPLPCY